MHCPVDVLFMYLIKLRFCCKSPGISAHNMLDCESEGGREERRQFLCTIHIRSDVSFFTQ